MHRFLYWCLQSSTSMTTEQVRPEQPDKDWIRDAMLTVGYIQKGYPFIKTHKLWRGLGEYSWLIKGVVIVAIFLGLKAFSSVSDFFFSESTDESQLSLWSSLQGFSFESMSSYFDGGLKYVILAAIEVLIFHITRKTLLTVSDEKIETSFKSFIKAEKRMIAVAFMAFGLEIALTRVGGGILRGFGLDSVAIVWIFLVQSFYFGFALIDNYNEIYGMTIKQSHRYAWQFAPVALITGAVMNILMHIPLIGVVLGSIFCAVVTTLTMHHLSNLQTDMAWVFVEKRKKKKAKRKSK